MNPFTTLTSSRRIVSMRVHGTSANIQYNAAEPERIVTVTRLPGGTSIQSNYPAQIEAYFSIPTPVIVERGFSLVSILRRLFSGPAEKVFEGVRLRVVRVEVYTGENHGINLDRITVMDGDRKLASAQISALPLIDANSDPYLESSTGSIVFELNHEVRTALGIEISGGFVNWGTLEENQLQLVAAKAVFVSGI